MHSLGAQLLGKCSPRRRESELCTDHAVAAIVTTCTRRKKIQPAPQATAVFLPIGRQETLSSEWLNNLAALRPQVRARDLYAGRAFGLSVQAAGAAAAKLYVVSAGLGLVEASSRVPPYGLTVARGQEDSLADKVIGGLDSEKWFAAMLAGRYSNQWVDIAGKSGRILMALTCPYAKMIGASLLDLDNGIRSRLRIFGAALDSALPAELLPSVMPYDERLDAILPGTRVDFSQRALSHFVNSVLPGTPPQDRNSDAVLVEDALNGATAPDRPQRLRQTDDEILQLIMAQLEKRVGIGKTLRELRDSGVACEQSRFGRLYRVAIERRASA